jgi:hypothetical protein
MNLISAHWETVACRLSCLPHAESGFVPMMDVALRCGIHERERKAVRSASV